MLAPCDALAVARDRVGTIRQDVVPAGAADDPVAPAVSGVEDVVSGAAVERVAAGATRERVVAGTAVEDVVAAEAEQPVGAAEAEEPVRAGSADEPVRALRRPPLGGRRARLLSPSGARLIAIVADALLSAAFASVSRDVIAAAIRCSPAAVARTEKRILVGAFGTRKSRSQTIVALPAQPDPRS